MRLPLPPLPPPMARLHELLDRHGEAAEDAGTFLAEQDRRPADAGAARLPVLLFVSARSYRRREAAGDTGRHPPDWMAEFLRPGEAASDRLERAARAGVREFWRVELGDGPGAIRIAVHTEPDLAAGSYGACAAARGDERVPSGVFAGLTLRPSDLAGGA